MKIAALGDIHGNYQALITVLDHVDRWRPDLVLVLGDIINRGPRSRECLHLIQERGKSSAWHIIKGNHEGYVLNMEDPALPHSGMEYELRRVIHFTYETLSSEDIQAVKDLPVQISQETAGDQLVWACHASSAGDRIGIYPDTPGLDLPGLINTDANLFLVGHTHQPFIRKWGKTTIINTGSVGLPFDGDTRASYAQLTYHNQSWQAEIVRIDYDQKAAEDDFYTSGFIPEGGSLADLILAELRLGWPQLSKWFRRYETAVLAGEISPQEAVAEFLLNPNIEYKNPDLA
ncbi:MAG TPA: metallophosphoesterase [Chloroflexi bacterium]|nr:metallophosphoesterase [Chloroflexota bacterium]